MGLAGEDEHDRPFVLVDDLTQPVQVPEQQAGAFVGGEAAREPDGQDVRILGVDIFQGILEIVEIQIILKKCWACVCQQVRFLLVNPLIEHSAVRSEL